MKKTFLLIFIITLFLSSFHNPFVFASPGFYQSKSSKKTFNITLKDLSQKDFYHSFLSMDHKELKELLKNSSKEQRAILYGIFQYGSVDFLLNNQRKKTDINADAKKIRQILFLFSEYPHTMTSKAEDMILKLCNKNCSSSYPTLSDYISSLQKKKNGTSLLRIFRNFSPSTSEDAFQDELQNLLVSDSSNRYTATNIGHNETYRSGKIQIFITDDISKKTTVGTLIVSRNKAPDWNTMYYKPTTWNCKLQTENSDNDHQIRLEQTTVTTSKDVNGYYHIMNFKIKLVQHAYYVYDKQKHIGSGNGFRLNFENYDQNNHGTGTIVDGIVKKDTTRTINWQINTAALGLRTFHKIKYTDCKSYLTYTRPLHTVTVDPNGGIFNGTSNRTDDSRYTGQWYDLNHLPSRDYYLFQGFLKTGSTYAYQNAGTGFTSNLSSGFKQSFLADDLCTRYSKTEISKQDYLHFQSLLTPENHTIRITGKIRITHLSSDASILLYEKNRPDETIPPSASFSSADGSWQTFDIKRTFTSSHDQVLLEIASSTDTDYIQFDLKNIIITDETNSSRISDTTLQMGDGRNADVTLTAQWSPLLYQINYHSGTDDPNETMQPQIIQQDTSVRLKQCEFKMQNAKFQGWKFKDSIYPENAIISYKDLATTPLQKRKTDADILPEKPEPEDTFTFTAVWDYMPTINLSEEPAVYLEGESIQTKQLLTFLQSSQDKEDGNLTDQVTIKKIEYTASKDGYHPKTQTIFSDHTFLDTYFLHLQKDETVTAFVTYSVADRLQNTAEATKKILIKYNHPPVIKASNLSFYQDEVITSPEQIKKEILENAAVSDIEDIKRNQKTKLRLSKPEPFDLSKMEKPGIYSVTYTATDSLKKQANKTIKIFIMNPDPYAHVNKQTIRFIEEKYIYTLSNQSIWKRNPSYFRYLQNSLKKTGKDAETIYTFSSGN